MHQRFQKVPHPRHVALLLFDVFFVGHFPVLNALRDSGEHTNLRWIYPVLLSASIHVSAGRMIPRNVGSEGISEIPVSKVEYVFQEYHPEEQLSPESVLLTLEQELREVHRSLPFPDDELNEM